MKLPPVEITYPCGAGDIRLTADPNVFDLSFFEGFEDAGTQRHGEPDLSLVVRQVRFVVVTLAQCVTTWDLTDNEDRPLPVSPETLSRLPHVVLWGLFGAVLNDCTALTRPAFSPNEYANQFKH